MDTIELQCLQGTDVFQMFCLNQNELLKGNQGLQSFQCFELLNGFDVKHLQVFQLCQGCQVGHRFEYNFRLDTEHINFLIPLPENGAKSRFIL